MFSYYGQWPDTDFLRAPRWRNVVYCVTFVAAFLFAANAVADQRVPLTLAQAEDLALQNEPGQIEFLARATALEEQSVAAGQLPDPSLRIGLANFPISRGGFTTEAMTQAQLGIRQAFPRRKSRALSTARLRELATAQHENADARLRDVLAATRAAWLEMYYWQSAQQVLTESRPFFVDLVTITRSMYSVGRKTQYDVLRAELELSRLDERLIDADGFQSAAQAQLAQWLGRDAYRPAAANLPNWESMPQLAVLRQNLSVHPRLTAVDAEIAARQAMVELAEESKKPGWALDLGYGYRDGFLPSGQPRSDFVSVSVIVDLPVFKRNRQNRKLSAALSERSAAVASKDRMALQLRSQLDSEYARWMELTRRLDLYEQRILELSRTQAEAALLAYQSDSGDFADVMRGHIDDLDTRLGHIRSQVERAQSYAVLANLGGLPR